MASASDRPAPIVFVIPGQRQARRGAGEAAAGVSGLPGRLKDSVRVSARQGAGEAVRVSAVPGEDVVLLHIVGGPVLVLHPETARDLMLGQSTTRRSAGAATPDEVAVPAQLRWRGLEQAAPTRSAGFLGDVLLATFEVVTGLVSDKAVDFAASQVVAKVDGQVDAGVYALRPQALDALKGSGLKLDQVPAPPDAETDPLLVLIHGTFVDTASTFGKLWMLHPQRVAQLFAHYGGRVYALDHPTVGASPVANALTLVKALPQGARLHLATHSRGGLVAEVLARVAGQARIGDEDLAFFAGDENAAQRKELKELAAAVHARNIRVDRVVRVACPARGTLLASKRLDAYLSVLKWTIELAGVPVVPALMDFLAEVARRRANPVNLPGLASMIPDTPLVSWLNAAEDPIAGELRVVAGDMQGDGIGSWVKTLLADALYWTDSDFVVQTRSAYGGSARAGGASFVLDQGGKSTHFNYFANERTVKAVVAGLTQADPAGYRAIGPLSWAGQDASGHRAARRSAPDGKVAGGRPAVFVLPGILGSHLKAGDKRIWLSLRLIGGLSRLRYQPGGADGVEPDGPIGSLYDDLMDYLAATHEVIPFSFDWRRPIQDESRRLADAVDKVLNARGTTGQPVRIVAHSMGGVLARTMQLERPRTFERLMAREGARLLMLGTPNGGSWAPMQVLSGDDTFGNALASFGSPLRDRQARQMMAQMPGFLQLQADLLDPKLALDRAETWATLASDDLKRVQENNWWHRYAGEQDEAAYAWGVPSQDVLDQACALRLRLDRQRDSKLKDHADKIVLVVGRAKFTPDGYEWGNDGFVYLNATDGGDGRVPLPCALLPGVRTWMLDAEHGSLPSAAGAFAAYADLLEKGDTTLLEELVAPTSHGGGGAAPVRHERSRPSRAVQVATPATSEADVFARRLTDPIGPASRPASLAITVLNGNLSFLSQALMVGHSRSLSLTGTEAVLDRLLGGDMKASLEAGLYPDAPGSHQIFINSGVDPSNPWRQPQPPMAIVVGLGEEGKLTEASLVVSVRQGVIAWAQRRSNFLQANRMRDGSGDADGASGELSLAATLMGSGGIGMHCTNAARAIAQGVYEANQRIRATGWPIVGHLWLVELYLERASDAWHGLHVLATAAPERYELTPTIRSGVGPLRRQIDTGYRGTDYDFITATGTGEDTISFALDTRRARTEIRAQSTQGRLLRELVSRASTAANQDPRLGHTLFQLLVPSEVEPFLAGTSRMLLELDDRTAGIPWELLDTRGASPGQPDDRPWAIRTQLLRKLRQTTFRQQVLDAQPDDAVLVIGEPAVDTNAYAPLPGARAEAEAVVNTLAGAGGLGADRVTALIDGNDATSIINALFERRYRIVHVAGHGEPVLRDALGAVVSLGGVVLSNDTFLGPNEIRSMRTVPELVFVNCCHLAARDASEVLRVNKTFNRAEFAWGMADSLIEIGVRCVIAAGWAVDDGPARVFAETFYREILVRRPFITAVAAAREAAWNADRASNTWAAYQAYGDPNWTLREAPGEAAAALPQVDNRYDGIASAPALALALEELAVQSRWMHADPTAQGERLRHLEARFAGLWGGMGAVAEAFGVAYQAAGNAEMSMSWYERALGSGDGSATFKAQEQLLNMRVRVALARARGQQHRGDGPLALQSGRAVVADAIAELSHISRRRPTIERLSLLGSACMRQAALERLAGKQAAERAALTQALDAYGDAETLAKQSTDPELFYPALNRMALQLRLQTDGARKLRWDSEAAALARASIQNKLATDPDFWAHVGLVELRIYESIAAADLASVADGVMDAYRDIGLRVSSSWMWKSVAEQGEFVLIPYSSHRTGAERDAAMAILDLLSQLAFPGSVGAQGPAGRPARPTSRRSAQPKATPGARTARSPQPPAAQPPGGRVDAVVWHEEADAKAATALARALEHYKLTVWQTAAPVAGKDLRQALREASLAVVIPGHSPPSEVALREWALVQEAAWRPDAPIRLFTAVSGEGRMPGFLRKAPSLDLRQLHGQDTRKVARLVHELGMLEGHAK